MATGFFDLNIPYDPPSASSATHNTALKLAARAMELGYTGIAYNRTIKSTLTSLDRCSIPLFSQSSLLAFAPSLASSISFRRDLLSVPRPSPFRQYTRLTFTFDSVSQVAVLTGANAVVSSYDIFAIQPLTQAAFDYACETAEVDLISIDFVGKLPFRLKMPMVKAAIKRGVYFEIGYSGLLADDLITRKHALTNAKLLVHWTHGKNLIISSAAPSINEFRGPYDVANLLSLPGFSMERAKAAISRNCRNIITKALRKKHFYKETIRAEPLSSNEESDMKESLALDLSAWDPISSGEGDLQLDNLAQYFSDSTTASKTVKAIDFSSLVNNGGEIFLVGIKPNKLPVVTSANEKRGSDVVLEMQSAALDDEQMVLDMQDKEDRSVTEGGENSRKSEDDTVILSDHVSLHIMHDDVKAGVSLFSKCKNHEEAMQERGDAASEPGLLLDDHHIPLLATSDDKKVAFANRETLNVVDVEEQEQEQEQDVGTEKVFVQEDDSIVKDNSSVSMSACIQEVKEEEEHRDVDIESVLVLDDDLKVTANTPVQPGRAKRKRKKKNSILSPSEPLEEHKNEDRDINCIPILDDCSNVEDKDNSSFLSSSGKARRKQKKHRQLLISPSKTLEEHRHGDVDTSNIPFLDNDSNVKDEDNSSFPSSPGKARRKWKKHRQTLLHPSKPLEEHRHEDADVSSHCLLNDDLIVKDKDNYSVSSPPGKAKAKRRRHHNKCLSPSKHVEEEQYGEMDAESIHVPGGDSNAKDNYSIPYSPVGIKPNEEPLVTEKPGGHDLVTGIDQTSTVDIDSGCAYVADGAELNNLSTSDAKTDILSKNINLLPPHIKMPMSSQGSDVVLEVQSTVQDGERMALDVKDREGGPVIENILGKVNSRKSEVDTVILSDHVPFHVMDDDMKADVSLFSNCKNHEEAFQELEQERGNASSGPGLLLDYHHIPLLATSDDKKGAVANCETLSVMVMEEQEQEQEQEQGVGTEKVFVRKDDSIDKVNPPVSRDVCTKEVNEEQEHRDVDTESNLVLDDSKVKANTPVQPGKSKRKRKKHKPLLSPTNPLEEHKNEDMGDDSIPILDDNSNDKDRNNSPTISAPGKARRRKRKSRQPPLLSSSKPLEEHMHEDVDANDIPFLDYDSNVKGSAGKAREKQKKYHQSLLSSSKSLEEHRHKDADINSTPLLDEDQNVENKDNHAVSSSPEKAKVKQRRHREKGLSSLKHLEEQHGKMGAESIPLPGGDS